MYTPNTKKKNLNIPFHLNRLQYSYVNCKLESSVDVSGFHLHLLEFPFVYQIFSRMTILMYTRYSLFVTQIDKQSPSFFCHYKNDNKNHRGMGLLSLTNLEICNKKTEFSDSKFTQSSDSIEI